jgi:hypothetical protein
MNIGRVFSLSYVELLKVETSDVNWHQRESLRLRILQKWVIVPSRLIPQGRIKLTIS